ncbi:TIGR02444 family protein [Rhodovibrionaceae bacterium A322]
MTPPPSGDFSQSLTQADGNLFWAFSLSFYGRPQVPDACLTLQALYAADVNLLLYGLWRGQRGETLSSTEWDRLLQAVEGWHREVVRPLRAARSWLKTQETLPAEREGSLRQTIKQQELIAERREQDILFACLPIPPGDEALYPQGRRAAEANSRAYLKRLSAVKDGGLDAQGQQALGLLLVRLFPDQR